jgi:hypothetical protein
VTIVVVAGTSGLGAFGAGREQPMAAAAHDNVASRRTDFTRQFYYRGGTCGKNGVWSVSWSEQASRRRTVRGRYLLTTLAVTALTASATRADDLSGPQIMRDVYRGIVASGSPPAARTTTILMNPGVAIDSWSEPNDAVARRNWSAVLDVAPSASWLFKAGSLRVSEIYERVLTQGIWATSTLVPDERTELAAIEAQLFSDRQLQKATAGYQAYLDLKARRDDLRSKWNALNPADRTATMRADLDDAESDLKLKGRAPFYLGLLGRQMALTRVSPADIARDRLTRFRDTAESSPAGTFHAVLPAGPAPLAWSDDWTRVTLRWDSSPVDTGVDALPLPAGWDIWKAGQGARFELSEMRPLHASAIEVAFDVRVLELDRRGLDATVFTNNGWRWKDPATGPLSSGGDSPSGLLPFLPTHVILARNVSIDGATSAADRAWLQRQIASGAPVGFGPFVLAGRYLEDAAAPYFFARRNGTRVTVDDAQIIGWIGDRVERSPDPNQRYVWPD